MTKPHPNAHLIGNPQARSSLATPALILDLAKLDANIAVAAKLTNQAGKALRPHFKAHKSLEIARRQLESGAVGLCVATVSEAEVASELDAEILITSIVSTETQCRRIADLKASHSAVIAVIDHPNTALRLEQSAQDKGVELDVLIDLDMRRERSGCPTPKAALELVSFVKASPTLRLRGLQAYAGQLSHIQSFEKRSIAYAEFASRFAAFQFALKDVLPSDAIISGGSTGSMSLDLTGPLTELQCGTYAMMDVEYLEIDSGWETWPFQPALTVQSTVLSAHWADHVITDAGDKWFANKYGALPLIVSGAPEGAKFEPISDEHARITSDLGIRLKPGDLIDCIPPHCDPTINLYSAYHVFDQERLLETWEISARGQ